MTAPEIAENLHRAELTPLERSEHIAEWVRLTGERKGAQVAPPGGTQPHDKGIKAATRELGIDRTEAQRAVKIDGLSDEAKQAAREIAGLILRQPPRRWPRSMRLIVALAFHEACFRFHCRRLARPVEEVRQICRAARLSGRRR